MRIRSHLLLFAFGVILPVAAFSVFLTTLLVDREQRTFAAGAIERLRSTMNAVDAQVQGQITALNALAALEELERGDLAAFRVEAVRVLGSQPAWLDNALKFSPESSAVEVSVKNEGSECAMEVADQGAGLTPEMMERAFDLFVQSSQGLARKSGGMGIGLAVVKRLAEYQGGTVSVESEGEGRGARFTVRFPCVPAPAAARPQPVTAAPLAPQRILLIDDNEDLRKTIAVSLAAQGHHVTEAADGRQALELAATAALDVRDRRHRPPGDRRLRSGPTAAQEPVDPPHPTRCADRLRPGRGQAEGHRGRLRRAPHQAGRPAEPRKSDRSGGPAAR